MNLVRDAWGWNTAPTKSNVRPGLFARVWYTGEPIGLKGIAEQCIQMVPVGMQLMAELMNPRPGTVLVVEPVDGVDEAPLLRAEPAKTVLYGGPAGALVTPAVRFGGITVTIEVGKLGCILTGHSVSPTMN